MLVLLFVVVMSCSDSNETMDNPVEDRVPSLAIVNKHSLARAYSVQIPIGNYTWQGFDIFEGDSRTFVLDKGLTGSMTSIRVRVLYYCGTSQTTRKGFKDIDVPFVNGKTTVINMVTQPNTLGCEFFDLQLGS